MHIYHAKLLENCIYHLNYTTIYASLQWEIHVQYKTHGVQQLLNLELFYSRENLLWSDALSIISARVLFQKKFIFSVV